MTMVERMARAAWAEYAGIPQIREDWMDDEDWQEDHVDAMARWPEDAGTHIGADGFRRCARAALTALLDPSQVVINAGDSCDPGYGDGNARAESHWQAMIEAALGEKAPE